jgi:hypothetical protein
VKTNDHAVAAGHSVDPARWQEAFEAVMSRIASRFARVEPRRRVRDLVRGLLSDLPRKNCWTIAEWAGETSPDGMQHLLVRAKWDADAVRDDVREYVLEHLHDEDAVLIVDETGDVKRAPNADVGITCLMPNPQLCRIARRESVRGVALGSRCGIVGQGCFSEVVEEGE